MYSYPWYYWIAFFYIYCFIGWVFESTYVSLKEKKLINRGFLRLPILPLYGTGALMMLWLALPVKDNLVLVFCTGVVAATVLEYATGYLMELLFKVRYWDYSNAKLNLHGYICLTSSLAWGLLTILFTQVVHQTVQSLLLSLPAAVLFALLGIISFIFVADCIQSVKAALVLARALEAITKIRIELEELQLQLALLKAETSQYLKRQIKRGHLKAASYSFTSAIRQKLTAQLEELTEKRHTILRYSNNYLKGLLRGNPTATSNRFAEALKELREALINNR